MYFSANIKQIYINRIIRTMGIPYKMKLSIGSYNSETLDTVINNMFNAWNSIIMQSQNNYTKNFKGYIRKFIIEYSKEKKLYTPYFSFILLASLKNNFLEQIDYKFKMNMRICWFRAWCNATKNATDTYVELEELNRDKIEWHLYDFLDKYNIDINTIKPNSMEYIAIKDLLSKHRLFTTSGIFKVNKKDINNTALV